MNAIDLMGLADRIETTAGKTHLVGGEVIRALNAAFGSAASAFEDEQALLQSTDAALRAIDATIPGWEISVRGLASEPDGHWTCSLREASVTDDDAVIGLGRSPVLANSLIAALLRIAASKIPYHPGS